jgi:DNA sulfur modification protein DndD
MILSKITLKNFKVYYGVQSLSCGISELSKPLVLIGGNTGSGKTSIIEAIKLCLYGARAKQLLNGFRSYQALLHVLHNRKAKDEGGNRFGVSVEFLLSDMGNLDRVEIERTWHLKNGKYKESLHLRRNGDELEFIEPEYWQDFIEDISPIGLTDFLYFDSEDFHKIPNYLENGFTESLLKFLGVSVYQQLDEDLGRQIVHMASQFDQKLAGEVEDNCEKVKGLKKEINSRKRKVRELKKNITELRNTRDDSETKLTRKAGKFAKNQKQVIIEKEGIHQKLRENQAEYETICGELMPFGLANELTNELITQLRLERTIKKAKAVQSEFTNLGKRMFRKLSGKLEADDLTTVKQTWKQVKKIEIPKGRIVHDISEKEADNIINDLDYALVHALDSLKKNRRANRHLRKDLDAVNRTLGEIKPTGPSHDLYLELKEVNKQIGHKMERMNHHLQKLSELEKSLKHWERMVGGGEKRLAEKGKSDRKIELADKTRKVIRKYKEYLLKKKFSEIRQQFLVVLNKLSVKTDLVHNIEFDLNKNSLRFVKEDGQSISPTDLSSGESEIIALSLLWAINKVSGKQHPIVTDSPFNRLDSNHRKNFVKSIIKGSDRQVIFLSTDKEIEKVNQYDIAESVDKYHLISYNKKKKISFFSSGYYG